jgi:hypothetical protein
LLVATGAALRLCDITFFEDDVAAVPETARLRLLPSCSSCISASSAAEIDAAEVDSTEVDAAEVAADAEVDAAGADAGADAATGVDLAFGTPKERFVSFEETVCTLSASSSLWVSSLL